jgi:hypothetical protein
MLYQAMATLYPILWGDKINGQWSPNVLKLATH